MTTFTKSESKLLEFLADGKIHSIPSIYEAIGSVAYDNHDVVREHIQNIRRKLGKDFLVNWFNEGYSLKDQNCPTCHRPFS